MKDGFQELLERRLKWVSASKENGFDFNDILAGAYHEPSHFIYEILQNADDEDANSVRFELTRDGIDIYHDGKDFDLKDVEGVTGIGTSKKRVDLTSIGKFGVGFKSVFAVTETPFIFSGEYNFKITDFVVPTNVGQRSSPPGTRIELPFNHSKRSVEDLYNSISHKLETIELKTLLFLKNIKRIYWKTTTYESEFVRSEKNTKIPNIKIVTLRSFKSAEKYIVVRKDFTLKNKKLRVEVAYRLQKKEDGTGSIVKDTDTRLVVFMPTETQTFLNFIIQGPFRTTPNRENVPLEDKDNELILEEIGNLVADSIPLMKDLGYLNADFLQIMPIDTEPVAVSKIYSVIFGKVKEKLSKESLLPTTNGKFRNAEEVLLARGKELTEFLSDKDIRLLFSRESWLDTSITYDRTRNLRDYVINELNVPEVDFETFARRVNLEFLATKSDYWMIEFYSRLLGQEALWTVKSVQKGILRTKPIIRLESGAHIAPFSNDGQAMAYLPANGKSEYKTVKRKIVKDDGARKFLVALGLTKPDQFAEIREFILPRYKGQKTSVNSDYLIDFEKLLAGYENVGQLEKDRYIADLKELAFVDCVDNKKGGHRLCEPDRVYFTSKQLLDYFSYTDNILFVSEQLVEHFKEERLNRFLSEVGVSHWPRRIRIQGNLPRQEKNRVANTGITYEIHDWDYELDGLKYFLTNIDPEKSLLLWTVISNSIKDMSSARAREFFCAEFSWFRYYAYSHSYEASFTRILKSLPWVLNENKLLVKPSEIAFSERSELYGKGADNDETIKEVLGFKSEAVDLLPPEIRKKVNMVKDIPIDSLQNMINEYEKKTNEETEEEWIPEVSPSEPPLHILSVAPSKLVPIEITIPKKTEPRDSKTGENPLTQRIPMDPKKKKKIGGWGEEFVFNSLKKDYEDCTNCNIIWLNENGDVGKGYDIVIEREDSDPEFVEVKTKTTDTDELIEVTGTQWETARTLFEQGAGERYSICVVHNPGVFNARAERIVNPVKLWKEGMLYAHPINIRF